MLMKVTLFEEYLPLEMASVCFYLLIENVLFFSNNRILRNCFKKVTSIHWSRNFIHFYILQIRCYNANLYRILDYKRFLFLIESIV